MEQRPMTEPADRIFELFSQAIEASPDDLDAWLAAHCSDPALSKRIRALVLHDRAVSDHDTFLKSPVLRPAENRMIAAPRELGGYRIVRELGRGGMGTVYEAVQTRPSRTVALKLIRPDLASESVLKRFEQEAEVLARLDHPGIAHIYDAGVAEESSAPGWQGAPWFAMELVPGRRLDDWVRERRPSVRDRLSVLAQIADALHHAHQKGVIHRDIKPANILVTDDDSPKLLDFGVARLTDEALRPTGLDTGTGRMIGTLAYMSPEQLDGSPDRLDVRTDVYSLGAVAYELLTERLPHDTTNRSLVATMRAIQEGTPERIGRLTPELRGDIETVIMTAMARDPDRRYPSASEFAADVRRVLGSQPISARPASAVYHLRCFAKRHRTLVTVSGVALVALVASLAVVSVLALRLSDAAFELDRRARVAERESARVVAISDFLERTLTAADPFADYAAAPQTRVGELLARAEPWLDSSFAESPFAEAAARSIVGRTYKGLGSFADAERQIRAAVERLDQADASEFEDRDRVRFAGLLAEHAVVLMYLDRTEESLAQLARSETVAESLDSVPDREASVRLGNAGWVLRRAGKLEDAKEVMRMSIEAGERAGSAADRDRAFALANLAGLHTDLGEHAEAAERYAESEPIIVGLYGEDHPYLGVLSNSIGRLKLEMGDLEGATSAFSNALQRLSATVGVQHPRTLTVLNNLAYAQSEAGDYAASEQTYRDALDGLVSVYGTDHREYRSTLRNYAWLLWEIERFWEASEAWAQVASGFQAESGEDRLLGLMYEVYAAALAVMDEPTDERIEWLVGAFDRQIEAVDVAEPQAQSGLRQVVAALEMAGREDLLERYRAMLTAPSGQ
jgi:serine/threonine protein kinase